MTTINRYTLTVALDDRSHVAIAHAKRRAMAAATAASAITTAATASATATSSSSSPAGQRHSAPTPPMVGDGTGRPGTGVDPSDPIAALIELVRSHFPSSDSSSSSPPSGSGVEPVSSLVGPPKVSASEVVFRLPSVGVSRFSSLLDRLEDDAKLAATVGGGAFGTFGVKAYGVSVTTLEDVFLKVVQQVTSATGVVAAGGAGAGADGAGGVGGAVTAGAVDGRVAGGKYLSRDLVDDAPAVDEKRPLAVDDLLLAPAAARVGAAATGSADPFAVSGTDTGCRGQCSALLSKRWLMLKRDRRAMVTHPLCTFGFARPHMSLPSSIRV